MLCSLCTRLSHNVARPWPHEQLHQIGLTERIAHGKRQRAGWVTHYQCGMCQTRWRHVDDPQQTRTGWSTS